MLSSPAIGSDGTVYIGSIDNKLYAIKTDSKGPAKSPWPMRGQNPMHIGRIPNLKAVNPVATKPVLPADHPRGGFSITTDPVGARVTLGDEAPQETPANFQKVPVGKYTMVISKHGFKEVRRVIEIEKNNFSDLGEVSLERAFGKLELTTTPAGLDYQLVALDLKKDAGLIPLLAAIPLQGKTPVKLDKVPAGNYGVIYKRVGWRDGREGLVISDGVLAKVPWDFPEGKLLVETDPPGAVISVNGMEVGRSPQKFARPAGAHEVTATYQDWKPLKQIARIEKDKEGKLLLAFDYGKVKVVADPADSVVTINGMAQGKSPGEINVPAGETSVMIQYKDWPELKQTIDVAKGKTEEVKIKYNYGGVTIKSDPEGAKVTVNGKESGVTPLKLNPVRAGKVDITVQYKDWPALKQAGVLKAGQQEAFTLNYSYGRAKITSSPEGADVILGEEAKAKKIGNAPLDIMLPAGSHKLELRSSKHIPEIKMVRILKGETAELDFKLLLISGISKWEFEAGDNVNSGPAIGSDGMVYVGSNDKKLYAINGKTGDKLWEFEARSLVTSSPAI